MRYLLCGFVALLFLFDSVVCARTLPTEELVEIGRRIYQHGQLPDGNPVKAIVLGNVEVSGTQFTCLNCHRRSGLGGPEGTKYVLPTNGASLIVPRKDIYMPRPAYDESSFAGAMRSGRNPVGAFFDPIMPRFQLTDLQMSALFAYLMTISNEFSPGLSDEVLHVATIVSDGIQAEERQAMLDVIEKFFSNKNAETRHEKKRYESGPFYQEYRNKAYRRWQLHVWKLTGEPATWQQQLEEYYRQQQVFALLSGRVEGSWEPVHRFSRDYRIPCILPNTDRPVVEQKNDFYTLYYSKGLHLEAQVVAQLFKDDSAEKKILQVYRSETDGEVAAHDLAKLHSAAEVGDFVLPAAREDWSGLARALRQSKPDRLILWLDGKDLKEFAAEIQPDIPCYLSSSLLGADAESIPASLRFSSQLIHLFNLPEDHRARFLRVASWMKVNKVPLTDQRLQGQTYYACMLLNAGMKHIKRYFYREFFLDLLDHGERMAAYSGNYPRLSFGPEQRFLAKGGYVVDLQSGRSEWIVPDY